MQKYFSLGEEFLLKILLSFCFCKIVKRTKVVIKRYCRSTILLKINYKSTMLTQTNRVNLLITFIGPFKSNLARECYASMNLIVYKGSYTFTDDLELLLNKNLLQQVKTLESKTNPNTLKVKQLEAELTDKSQSLMSISRRNHKAILLWKIPLRSIEFSKRVQSENKDDGIKRCKNSNRLIKRFILLRKSTTF